MRVGFFGNTNNYPLLLAEAMRRAGHEVVFVVNKVERLHRPESRDPRAYGQGYPDWMLDASHLSEVDFLTLQPQVGPVLDQLADCDALVLNDLGPSFLPLLDRPAVTFLTGSDLDYYASRDLPEWRMRPCSEDWRTSAAGRAHRHLLEDFVERHRQGLRTSVAVNWALPGLFPVQDALLAECGVAAAQVVNFQMADLERITAAPSPDNRVLRVFCGTRLTWKLPVAPGRSPLDYKGTDVMVRGVARFCRTTGQRVELCLVRKGLHIAETEALIAAEGLDGQVTWLSEMPLQDLWREFAASDVIVEQLGGSIISMVALDAMASGRPVIGNARPDVPTVLSAAGSPLCQAATAEEVCGHLQRLAADPAERLRIGRAGREFVTAHFSPARAAALCIGRLAASPPQPSASRSRLLAALAEARTATANAELRLIAAEAGMRAVHEEDRQRLLAVLRAQRSGRRKSLVWRSLTGPFSAEGARGWRVEVAELEAWADGDDPRRSSLLLFEDERLLGPAHSVHKEISMLGGGRYSHWRSGIYFSTTDGSDPNHNGRAYTIALATPAVHKSQKS